MRVHRLRPHAADSERVAGPPIPGKPDFKLLPPVSKPDCPKCAGEGVTYEPYASQGSLRPLTKTFQIPDTKPFLSCPLGTIQAARHLGLRVLTLASLCHL